MTKDQLPTHDTRAIPPPPRGIHLIEHIEGDVFMMGWDGEAPQPISLYEDSILVDIPMDSKSSSHSG